MIANVRKGLDTVLATAPPLTQPERWKARVRYIIDAIIKARPQHHPPPPTLPPATLLISGG